MSTEPAAIKWERLRSMVCSTSGCKDEHSQLFFHSRCHPTKATWVDFDRDTDTLSIRCSECAALVLAVRP